MCNKHRFLGFLACILPALAVVAQAGATITQAFTYQGQLMDSGVPADGAYTLSFRLFDDPAAGTQIGATITLSNVAVADGLFTVVLNTGGEFGPAAFNGAARWLEISVNGTKLAPRQALTVTPYAVYALNAWQLGGNAGTDASTNFLGTTDDAPLEFRAKNKRALRLRRSTLFGAFEYTGVSVLAGAAVNEISSEVPGATIAGGGLESLGGRAVPNRVTDVGGTVGGGVGNLAGNDAGEIDDAWFATVGGGDTNRAIGADSTVAGGASNEASGGASTVAGGLGNEASGPQSTVAGGVGNVAAGYCSSTPGGFACNAGGDFSLAAGRAARVRTAAQVGGGDTDGDEGTFVWADSGALEFQSTGPNQFLIRAAGGVGINTNAPESTLHVKGGAAGNVTGHADAPLVVENSSNAFINILSPDAGARGVLFGAPTDGNNAGSILYNASSTKDGFQFRVNGNSTGMVIGSNGFVGIGVLNPDTPLDVKRSKGAVAAFDRTSDDGVVVAIQQDGTTEGTISVSGSTVSYNSFTGSHLAWADELFERGELVTMTGENRSYHDQPGAEVVYGVARSTRANDPACLGAYLGRLDVSAPDGTDNPQLVMAVGNGEMWVVDDGRGDIRPGDYLIASDVPGCAMRDDAERFPVGHVVARAAEPVAWERIVPAADGPRRARISVLFSSFDRHVPAERLERVIAEQQRQIDELRAQLDRLEQAGAARTASPRR